MDILREEQNLEINFWQPLGEMQKRKRIMQNNNRAWINGIVIWAIFYALPAIAMVEVVNESDKESKAQRWTRVLPERPPELDDAGWASLQQAIRNSVQQAKLLADDGGAYDEFGHSVAISGDTALVGAYRDFVGVNNNQGSAYVFTRSGTTWTQQAKLVAADGAAGDLFGISVALADDTALVGAIVDDVGATINQGSAYVFTRSGTTWTQQAKLVASDGGEYDQFGSSVALSGDTALVGADVDDVGNNFNQGSAYVFTRSGTVWTQQAQLVAADGAGSDDFGHSVAIYGDTALVGAPSDSVGDNFAHGSAYVFTRNGMTWTQQAQLVAADGAREDYFGWSVNLSGDTALVGARFDDVGANINQGSAYVFTRSGTTWAQQAQLVAADGSESDQFGFSVALSGNTALVGAIADRVGNNIAQGSAYLFAHSGTTWMQQAQLVANDGVQLNLFGWSVALSGDTALVGMPSSVGANLLQGSAYVYQGIFKDGFEPVP